MEEKRTSVGKHMVSMENRERITMTGIVDVLSFDEEAVVVQIEDGLLLLHGEGLHVGRLNLDEGEVLVDGLVSSLEYVEEGIGGKGKHGFLSRLLR